MKNTARFCQTVVRIRTRTLPEYDQNTTRMLPKNFLNTTIQIYQNAIGILLANLATDSQVPASPRASKPKL